MALADLVQEIKGDSSDFINKKKWIRGKFAWQEGYGAFSYGHSQLDTIVRQSNVRHASACRQDWQGSMCDVTGSIIT
jgi:hypothetical protein